MVLVDALAAGVEQEGGVGAAAAEEEAPEEGPVPAVAVQGGAHLGVLLCQHHLPAAPGAVATGRGRHVLPVVAASEEAAGDDVHRGELDAAVGGVHLRDVGLRGLARRHRVIAAAGGGRGRGHALGDVLQRHAAQAGAVAQQGQLARRPLAVDQRHKLVGRVPCRSSRGGWIWISLESLDSYFSFNATKMLNRNQNAHHGSLAPPPGAAAAAASR